MATASIISGNLSESARPVYRLTVEQYERMAEVGILTERDRVELLEGILVTKMTQNPPHNAAIDMTREALEPLLPAGWRLREQKAIRLSDSEPEPDLAIVRGPLSRYATSHPHAQDVTAVIEVADTSLVDDRSRKARIYARAKIPVYWIINLNEGQVEVYTSPKGGKVPAYRSCRVYERGDAVSVIVAGQEVGAAAVNDLMP